MTDKITVILLCIALLINTACTTPVGLITKYPEKYNKKKVKVKGKVVSSIQLEDLSIFAIRDNTGTISIITTGYLPVKDDYIKTRGTVINNFKYSKEKMVVIKENVKIHDKQVDSVMRWKYIGSKRFKKKGIYPFY